jgi:UDP-glucose 4-epimerase
MVAKSRVLNTERSVFSATRYGNVIGSRGSVIPLFINQIKTNQPITITNPEMTRFLMSLDDAVNLVFYAFQNAQQGDLFVQKSPASTIKIVAQALIEIYGSKSKIKYIGTRHGEKLYETLISKEDMVYAEDLGDYFRVPADNRSLNYEVFYTQGNTFLNKSKDYHSHNTTQLTLKEVIELLMKLPLIRKDILGETYKT